MSTTIDSRIVEMRFDNKHFESNVSTTMSTLDKFKQKLNLTGASKGLEDINTAARKVDLSGIGIAIDKVGVKFNGLYTIADQTLRNITNKAMYYGEKITSALTTDPIKTGFSEYETQINAIQTILANTSSKGTTLDQVNDALDKLNTYADKTIYNFTEMTRNIGTFTAAGVDLDTSVKSIQGIANIAAISGSTSQQASNAMYQLSQALAAGKITLMDWNSVVNAGMGGQVFQDALINTSKAMAKRAKELKKMSATEIEAFKKSKGYTDEQIESMKEYNFKVDEIIEKTGSFRNSLTQGEWLTTDVLTQTLEQFTMAAEEGTEEWEKFKKSLKESGYTEKQAEEILKMANTATDAATKVKTLTQLWDTLKEAAQSGWTQTWELIVGDFESAKKLLTTISDTVGEVINNMSMRRNNVLKGALYGTESKWDALIEKIEKAGVSTDDFKKKLKETAESHGINIDEMIKQEGSFDDTIKKGWLTKEILLETLDKYTGKLDETSKSTGDASEKLKEFQKVVDDVWLGLYGNGRTKRFDLLEKAGYDAELVQSLVNLTEHVEDHKIKIEDLSQAQLENMGLTKDQAEAIHKLGEEAKATGTPIAELIEDLSRPSGRELLIQSFANIVEAIKVPLDKFREAWVNVFGEVSEEAKSEGLYKLLDWLEEFTAALIMEPGTAENFKKVCEALLSLWQISYDMINASLNTTIKLIKSVLGLFGMDLMDLLGKLSDYIIKISKWLRENTFYYETLSKISEIIYEIINGVIKCANAFLKLTPVKDVIENVKDAVIKFFDAFNIGLEDIGIRNIAKAIRDFFNNIVKWIKGLEGSENLGRDIVDGLVNGIKQGISDAVDAIISLATTVIETFKSILGINSPSKVFYAIGAFMILGLINGIKDTGSALLDGLLAVVSKIVSAPTELIQNGVFYILDFVKEIFTKLKDTLSALNIDFGQLFVMGSIIGLFIFLKKLIDVFDKISTPIKGIGDVLGAAKDAINGISESIQKNINAKTLKTKSEALKNIAISIGILAGALIALSYVRWEDLVKAGIALGALGAGLVILMNATTKIKDPTVFGKLGLLMISISGSLLLMAFAIKQVSSVNFEDSFGAVISLSVLVGAIVGMLTLFGRFANEGVTKNIDKAGKVIRKMATTLLIMALVIKVIGTISTGDIWKGIGVMVAFELLIAAMMFLTKSDTYGKHADKMGSMLIKMSVAIGIMALVIKIIAGISVADIAKGIITMGLITIMFAAIVRVSEASGEHASKAGSMLLKMSIAIGILALTIKLIGSIPQSDIQKGLRVIGESMILFGVFIILSNMAGEEGSKAGGMLLKMSAAMLILAVTIKLAASLSIGEIIKGSLAILAFGVLSKTLIIVSKEAGQYADKAGAMLLKMSFALLVVAGTIAILGMLDVKDVLVGTIAIGALIFCFREILKVSNIAVDCSKSVYALAIVIGVLAGSVALLSFIEPGKLLPASAALSLLLGIFALLVKSTQYIQSYNLVKSMITMTLVVGALAGVLYMIQNLPVDTTIANATALSILLATISGSLFILSKAGLVSTSAVKALIPMVAAVAAIGIVVGVLEKWDLTPSIETATSLSILLIAMSAVALILTNVGILAPMAIKGAIAFDGMILIIGGLMVGIGALLHYVPAMEQFLDSGITVLEKIGYGLGAFIGNIAGGMLGGIGSGLPKIATDLSTFMTNLEGFIAGAKNIDPSVGEGVKALTSALLSLTAANLLNALTSWFAGEQSIADFGTQLSTLGTDLNTFATNLGEFDETKVTNIKNAGNAIKAMAEAASAIPNEGGWAAAIFGDNSIAAFGEQLPGFATNLASFATNLEGFDESKITTISAVAKVIKVLAEAAETIPDEGGWADKIFGDNSIAAFGDKLPGLATNISTFGTNLGEFDDSKLDTVKCAANAIKVLAQAAEVLPNEGGWLDSLFGDNSLSTFGGKLPTLGSNIASFASNLGEFNEDKVTTVKCACNAIKALANAASGIDGQPEWAKKIFGDNGLAAFSSELPALGTDLASFAKNLGTFDEAKVTTVKSAVNAIKALAKLADADLKSAKKNLPDFGEEIVTFAGKVDTFCTDMPSTESINTATSNLNKVVNAIKTVASADSGTFETFVNNLGKLGKDAVSKFVKTFTSAESKQSVLDAAKKLAEQVVNGVEDKTDEIEKAFKEAAEAGKNAIRDKYQDFKEAGKYLVEGFADGISANDYKAKAKAKAMAKAAKQAAEEALGIESPSTEFYEVGDYAGQGFVNALDDYGNISYKSGYEMADSARSGLSRAIGKVLDLINTDMDMQPTIRPVLDLSDVQSGVGSINGMFGLRPSVGAMANLNAISYSMRNQNGANDDVVYAINKLRKDIGTVGGTSYNINGISYNDDTAVSEAIEALVRAIRLERRV